MRGRDEHYDLDTSQFVIGEDNTGHYVQFIDRANKTFKGGLKHMDVEPKKIEHYSKGDEPRSIVKLYQKYLDALDIPSCFYRRPMQSVDGQLKFAKKRVGVNKLESMMKTMCRSAGLDGNFTNQSAKRTCATTLFQQGVDEQLIMD